MRRQVEAQRGLAPVGDVDGAVRNLFDHYEEVGEVVLRALAQEGMHAAIRELTDLGRLIHQEWVARTFAPQLERVSGLAAERLLVQLVASTDVYVWSILRRDLGLERGQAELALREMIEGVLSRSRPDQADGGTNG